MFTLQNNLPKKTTLPQFQELKVGQIFEATNGDIFMKINQDSYDNVLLLFSKSIDGSYAWELESLDYEEVVYPIKYTITLNSWGM